MKNGKAILAILLVLIIAVCLSACSTQTENNLSTEARSDTSGEVSTSSKMDDPDIGNSSGEESVQENPSAVSGPIEVTAHTTLANYTSDEQVYKECLNANAFVSRAYPNQHLPVFRFDTKEELESFRNRFRNVFTMMDLETEKFPSFAALADAYDETYFEANSVVLAYVVSGSGSYRYAIQDISCEDGIFCLNVTQNNHPFAVTDNMAGWFVLAEVPKTVLEQYTELDAIYAYRFDLFSEITDTLKEEFRSEEPDELIHAQGYSLLSYETADSVVQIQAENHFEELTAFLYVHQGVYQVIEDEYGERTLVEVTEGTDTPAAITFIIGRNGEYSVKEFWTPGDDDYEASIRERFPEEAAQAAIDSEKTAELARSDSSWKAYEIWYGLSE